MSAVTTKMAAGERKLAGIACESIRNPGGSAITHYSVLNERQETAPDRTPMQLLVDPSVKILPAVRDVSARPQVAQMLCKADEATTGSRPEVLDLAAYRAYFP